MSSFEVFEKTIYDDKGVANDHFGKFYNNDTAHGVDLMIIPPIFP